MRMALDSAPENIWRGLLLDATRNAKTPDANLVVVGNAGVGKATLVRALGAAAAATAGATHQRMADTSQSTRLATRLQR